MKIWTKFIGSSVAVGIIISSLICGSAFFINMKAKSTQSSREKASQSLKLSLRLEVSLRDEIISLKDFLLVERNAANMTIYQKAMSNFLVSLDKLETLIPDNPQLIIIRRRHYALITLVNSLTNTSTTLMASEQDLKAINYFYNDLKFILVRLTTKTQEDNESARQEIEQLKQNSTGITNIFIIIILLLFVGQFMLILLPVIRSIQLLQLGATKIGAGNLDYRLDIHTQDEIEQLSHEFNLMATKLADFYNSLEQKVIERTVELSSANTSLLIEIQERKQAEESLQHSEEREREKAKQLKQTLQELQNTQSQLIQTEKMSSLGQLVAGIAHEINNPVNFIYGNVGHTDEYIKNLLELLNLYQQHYPNPHHEIQEYSEDIDLEFLVTDVSKMLSSMKMGADRIRQIVLSLRNFSRLDEADMKSVDIHEGINNTLLILQNKLKARSDRPHIEVIKNYGSLPLVECYAGQINQVFMNIISNAIDVLDNHNEQRSLEEIKGNPSQITISTKVLESGKVVVEIADNGTGMTAEVRKRLFDPFFTTKPIGKGTGLGLSISYQIVVEKHGGALLCESELGKGTVFKIEIPMQQN